MGNIKFLPFLLLFLGVTTHIYSQNSANATASLRIIKPIAIAETVALEFGTIITSTTQTGSVTIASATSIATYVTVVPYTFQGAATPSAAKFKITGDPAASYTLTLPSAIYLGLDGASSESVTGTLTVTDIETNLLGTASTGSLSLPSTGIATLLLGGKLNVGLAQDSGIYIGTYIVQVAYY